MPEHMHVVCSLVNAILFIQCLLQRNFTVNPLKW